CRILNYGHKFIPTPTTKQRMDITLPDNPFMKRSLDDLERRYNLLLDFGGGALYKLVNNKNIVITLTDKNLGLAVIPYNEYIKAIKMLLNPNDYEIVEFTEEECIEIMQTHILHLTMTMDNKHNNYFLPEETQLPFFHALPKVHKNPLKWRPIVGMHSSPTKRISVFLAQILKNWMEELEKLDPENWTPLRDNFQLIFQLKNQKRFNNIIT
ncbi:2015_t:CDS:2, partial [Racocetra fulgida]